MDPARLRLLRELGDRGSVVAVAVAMHVSASAVSQQLAALQAGVAVSLTVKRGRRLVLTEAGEALAAASVRVDEALAAARDAVGSFLEHDARAVRVSAFHSAGLALFGPLLAELAGAEGSGTGVALADADVAQGDFAGLTADHDLVVAHRLPHDPPWPTARLVVVPLLVEPLDVALHAGHPLASTAGITPDQLRDERWISTHAGFPLAGVLDHLGALIGEAPRIVHRVNEFSVAAQIVRAGDAIAVMPRTTGAPLAVDGMVLRPVVGATLVRHVDVLARPDALAQAPVRVVLAALKRVADAAADAGERAATT
ncbi:LysR family transcriptional regulator [Clavibacter michiganensis]|uniref:Transcriptional regulator, LysR-family n=1 Tax=Clavibacter michiganensis subsp. michiganensis (strain NCPPB 382) TaxID=443906 RepID=A5CUY2_CLAM3|nr:LysR family transcriptional regulator [Clavibacter michiganensis]MDO4017214.1 LysR family transcriptional regulator [Clavibacter michiganensis]MDO4037470.1 LysR family transcriptional regulator [Clavibacter michiganensis]MDO4039940.1 LysR family transcriptional regulator [Clavibacter michiganensis]MDO4044018.1 LysR family transcriptional regulator [Clavibacter michiganensis]MDO4049999.1 LysR family transcriptional regulator [Clavibacter michiganensis]